MERYVVMSRILQIICEVFFSLSDVNECAINNGGCEQICNNTIGSFICTCGSGYQLDENRMNCSGKIWIDFEQQLSDVDSVYTVLSMYADINECERDEDNCHQNANCTNTEGSYTCSCNLGYTGDGVTCTSK